MRKRPNAMIWTLKFRACVRARICAHVGTRGVHACMCVSPDRLLPLRRVQMRRILADEPRSGRTGSPRQVAILKAVNMRSLPKRVPLRLEHARSRALNS